MVIDVDWSCWMLKVGVGGMVCMVRVVVYVDEWNGFGFVCFLYWFEGDLVEGEGIFRA